MSREFSSYCKSKKFSLNLLLAKEDSRDTVRTQLYICCGKKTCRRFKRPCKGTRESVKGTGESIYGIISSRDVSGRSVVGTGLHQEVSENCQ